MPFMLYRAAKEPAGTRYDYLRNVSLAGSSGPLAKFSWNANPTAQTPFKWHAAAADILALLDATPSEHAILIDLKPRVSGNVSVYRLLDVWGYSYSAWTPLALRLEVIFGDRQEADPATFKRAFVDEERVHSLAGEFLYTQGGVSTGSTWNWGMVGRVNGALLWREAFDFLVTSLSQTI